MSRVSSMLVCPAVAALVTAVCTLRSAVVAWSAQHQPGGPEARLRGEVQRALLR